MDVRDFVAQRTEENSKKILIYNPLPHDFTWKYDGDEYTVPSKENSRFYTFLGRHLGKHIVDEYMNLKGISRQKAERLVFSDED